MQMTDQSSVREGSDSNKERCAISRLRRLRSQEYNISNHHKRRRNPHKEQSTVEDGTQKREQDRENGTNDIRWHSVQLQRDYTGFRVDGADDRWCEECKPLHGDVVKEENEGCAECDWAEDTEEGFLGVWMIGKSCEG